MELFGQSAILAFDGSVVGVVGDTQNFVVVFRFGSFELDLGFLQELTDSGGGGVVVSCFIQGLDAGFVFLRVKLALGERKKGGERMGFEG